MTIHNFEPTKLDIHDPSQYGKYFIFDEPIPSLPNLHRISILKGLPTLTSVSSPVQGEKIIVDITSPTGEDTIWSTGSFNTISWNVSRSSTSQSPILALVQYSPDGGNTLLTLGRDINDTKIPVNTNQLPGSKNGIIYVQVSDGFNTGSAKVENIEVSNKNPVVDIVSPTNNTEISAGIPFSLEGSAYDLEGNFSADEFVWTSDIDGMLGTGEQLVLSLNMTTGKHVIHLVLRITINMKVD